MTKLYPLQDRIIIKPNKEETEKISPGGIILPTIHKERPQIGEILFIGQYVEEKRLKPGKMVLFGKYAGTDLSLNNETVSIMREDDVLAIVEEEEEK